MIRSKDPATNLPTRRDGTPQNEDDDNDSIRSFETCKSTIYEKPYEPNSGHVYDVLMSEKRRRVCYAQVRVNSRH